MIVGATGFSWSGSSAVLDYLMEFDENQVYTPEFIFAYHPDGLHDLDVNLNENCAKFLSSGVAIPRFKEVANLLLDNPTKGRAKELTSHYLDQIIQAKWIGLEQGNVLLRKHKWLFEHVGRRIRHRVIPHLPSDFCSKYKPYPLTEMVFSICPEGFDGFTQEYILSILKAFDLDLNKNIILNQPFPGNNPVPYMRYFPDSKAIVVDRDPRDVFVIAKYVFPGGSGSYAMPLESVEAFCAYFENMHKNLNSTLDHPDVLYVQFEDLVYHYNETTEQIREFLGLPVPSFPRKYFVPEESEVNTQVFMKYGKPDEISFIESKLEKYLYDFSKVKKTTTSSTFFDDNPKSDSYTFK